MDSSSDYGFSILIPTWKNLEYLKLCIKSIKSYSVYNHQVIVFVNESNIEVLEWLQKNNIEYLSSNKNIGICFAMNQIASLAAKKYLVYMNDDMVALPGWDISFQKAISEYSNDEFFLSSTLIEPNSNSNINYPIVVADYGDCPQNFQEKRIIANLNNYIKQDWNGASWPVNLISKRLWNSIGGYSIEFSPGMYSDPDFSRKLWEFGVREFRGLGNCFFYHFGSKSTKRIRHNTGSATFLNKWQISARLFYSIFLKMGTPYNGRLIEPTINRLTLFRYLVKKKF